MARYMPNLNALRAFEAAGRLGGFSQAARDLNVTHAAISRHVHALEHQLGIPLFSRATRGVVLTDQGKAYLARITPALEAISKASEAVRVERANNLTISCETTFAMKWLMPRLGAFERAHPRIDVSLDASSTLVDIADNSVDLAIRYSRVAPEGLGVDLLSSSPMYPFAAPDMVGDKTATDISEMRLLHDDDGTLWREWFRKAGIPDVALPKPRRFNSLLAMEGALAGQGVILTSAELAAGDVAKGRLVQISTTGLTYGAYRLLYRQEALRRRPLATFRKWLIEETAVFRTACPLDRS